MKFVIILILVAALVAGAVLTKPDGKSFQSFMQKQANQGKDGFSQLLNAAGNLQESLLFDYEDYFVFAKVSAARGLEKREYLGLFSIWIQVK
ncbi:MAG: hypothetical protein JXR70_10105 [Spirochaetales bacterium]|nr:hypothetical protein [Spirochaetales bacterium]